MRRRATAFVLSCVVSVLASPTPAQDGSQIAVAPNLLVNGGFEDLDSAGVPAAWSVRTWSGAADFVVDSEGGRGGGVAVRIASALGADASYSQEVAVRPNARYRLSAWIRGEAFDPHEGLGALLNVHELAPRAKTEPVTQPDAEWTRVEVTFNSGDHTRLLVNMLFGGWGHAKGTAWFDDARLEGPPPLTEVERRAFYRDRAQPLLAAHCYECHGPGSKARGGLFLGNRDAVLRGGASGPVINEDEPDASLLLRAVHYDVFEMPPKGKLADADIETLTQWVRLGAPFDPALAVETPLAARPAPESQITAEHRAHWAFQRPNAGPAPPRVAASGWSDHPVDAFIARGLEGAGITPGRRADPQTLMRRAYHDLLGLPPSRTQVAAFLADDRPDAYERLIDELLASPHYGERWARHWLDVVRYAESNSFERDDAKPFVWRYRDYVIDAFNDDQPYDRFLVEQLAGDELPDANATTIVATGYYRLGQWDDEPADPEQARFDELDDILTTTAQGLLGLTVNCARCHDHKLDPIPQKDYYRLLAFFRNVRRYGVRSSQSVTERSVTVIATPREQREHAAAVEAHDADVREIETEMAAIAQRVRPRFSPVDREEFEHDRNRDAIIAKHYGEKAPAAARFTELHRRVRRLRAHPPDARAKALCVKERDGEPPATYVLARGNHLAATQRVAPGFPQVLGFDDPQIVRPDGGATSGRRLALARWITAPEHPLTWRVFVNRLWQHHFGTGIVASPNDFGLRGRPPSHPELLDWLAAEFARGGYRIKRMHKLMMTSRTYTQDYRRDPRGERVDPTNRLLWRFEPRRMTAEELRDSVLAVSGSLNRARGGPSVYPEVAAEVLAGQSRPGAGWPTSEGADRHRRSIYVHVKRSMLLPILEAFDAADTDFTCPVRFQTSQPTQALALLNSDFIAEQAATFAASLGAAHPADRRAQIEDALWRTLQRAPAAREIERGLRFVAELQRREEYDASAALARFCLLALNLNEFVYLR
ncbi:MAG: PSD1 and planctomycete cytochrome C domain-containing protein [Planctomycetota bacterium]